MEITQNNVSEVFDRDVKKSGKNNYVSVPKKCDGKKVKILILDE